MKYIRFADDTIISFTPNLQHVHVAADHSEHGNPVSAAFWKVDKTIGKIVVYGRSESLNIGIVDAMEDELFLNHM